MKANTSQKRSGFTLIEMLVVIAIIAILAGLLFPAINRALETAKRNQAAADVRSIAAAITMFYNDYGYLPVPFDDQGWEPGPGNGDFGREQSDARLNDDESKRIIQVLIAEQNIGPGWNNLNPRRKVYLSMQTARSDGELLDPWGNQYWIKLDRDLNGMVQFFSGNNQHRTRAVVFSRGRSGQMSGGTNNANARDNIANVELTEF